MGIETMKVHEYARALIKLRGQDLSVLKYLGARWIASKVALVLVAIVALLHSDTFSRCFGVFVLGYLFGVGVADIRR